MKIMRFLAGILLGLAAIASTGPLWLTSSNASLRSSGAVLGGSYTLARSALPMVNISSGSVSAAGAISGITALPTAYASAYCYFPANILATSIAAGWYYCTFSTTTAGTAFLDTYTTGVPTIPASPTAVTDGKGAFTGVTTEIASATITLPAAALGANGFFEAAHSWAASPNNANAKTGRVRFTGLAGTIFHTVACASGLSCGGYQRVFNKGAQAVQTSGHAAAALIPAVSGVDLVRGTIDSSVATTIVISSQKATATDNHILENFAIDVWPAN
jgi:hypothetical protein